LGPLGNHIYRMSSFHCSASCRPRFHFFVSSLSIS
ncbi:hypothetical protein T4B_1512, partial [Trichinella pseudospiralis]